MKLVTTKEVSTLFSLFCFTIHWHALYLLRLQRPDGRPRIKTPHVHTQRWWHDYPTQLAAFIANSSKQKPQKKSNATLDLKWKPLILSRLYRGLRNHQSVCITNNCSVAPLPLRNKPPKPCLLPPGMQLHRAISWPWLLGRSQSSNGFRHAPALSKSAAHETGVRRPEVKNKRVWMLISCSWKWVLLINKESRKYFTHTPQSDLIWRVRPPAICPCGAGLRTGLLHIYTWSLFLFFNCNHFLLYLFLHKYRWYCHF